ncbi:hypothetical protein GCM10007981_07080 [Thermocladium modestius]|uniref:Uncharacterized protein n=1 Tax=Thermocladium modestius TaxID=62609 RepID=A0A830GV06_9CREN|nr:hypothetical protein [Thermocladium modestius]GGP20154.1 hypothetical protein GCM10007981_07080 [Thermocladium modestius]
MVRIFNSILLLQVARSYSYYEHKDMFSKRITEASFTVRIEIPSNVVSSFFEDLSELLAELSSKMRNLKGIDVEFTVKKSDGNYIIVTVSALIYSHRLRLGI